MNRTLPGALVVLAVLAAPADAQRPQLDADTILVSGKATRYSGRGLADRRPGEPVVVFQGGAGGSVAELWDQVIARLEGGIPLLAYDRPGFGGSADFDGPPTPERVTEHLNALLAALAVPPPYILVGHSWGGPLILHHSVTHPGDVRGAVYVDPTDFLSTRDDQRALWIALGGSAQEFDERAAAREAEAAQQAAQLAQLPPAMAAELQVLFEHLEMYLDKGAPRQPVIPTSVLLAGARGTGPPPPNASPASVDPRAHREAQDALTIRRFEERFAGIPGATVRIVPGAGHNIMRDAPAAVVEEIVRILALVRAR